jgi:hypothetical protein
MTFVYIVRCNFNEPAKEQAWNDWYSGPKIAQMLAKPHFRTCQRFHLASGTGRNYLALWTLRSPDAFESKEYTTDWGFFDWSPYIVDWSRDLFDGGDTPEFAFGVQPKGALRILSFDGLTAEAANAAREAISALIPNMNMMWLPVIGLDRHTPLIGLSCLPDPAAVRFVSNGQQFGGYEAIYRPICDLYTAD